MIESLTLEDFLTNSKIEKTVWEQANIEWDILKEISADHVNESPHLENSADLFAKEIQKIEGVHSVRWRVKDPLHLMEKIVRKKAAQVGKYNEISKDNYHVIVSDLVGIRALHLFKENCFVIDRAIRELWTQTENPVAYIRRGDSEEMRDKLKNQGFEVKEHPAGYRSVHYVIESTPLKRKVLTEIQVRTIFEEGWSEIDHTVRYPNYSNNELVGYFLEIFNRMAGSADDMGGFVLGLVATLDQFEEQLVLMRSEKEINFKHMEEALTQLEAVKKQDQNSQKSIATLKDEIAKLKKAEAVVPSNKITQSNNHKLSSDTATKSLAQLLLEMVQKNAEIAEQRQKAITASSSKE